MDAEQDADVRLGTPEQLAAVAKVEFRRRTFAGRHPVWTFLVGPNFTVIATQNGTVLAGHLLVLLIGWLIDTATGGSLSAIEANGGPVPDFAPWVLLGCSTIIRFVPFALSAWVFLRLGRRSGRRWWSMAACGIVAAIAAFFSSLVIPQADNRCLFLVGFEWSIGFSQIVQAAVPLALGAWMLWRSSVSRPKTLTA